MQGEDNLGQGSSGDLSFSCVFIGMHCFEFDVCLSSNIDSIITDYFFSAVIIVVLSKCTPELLTSDILSDLQLFHYMGQTRSTPSESSVAYHLGITANCSEDNANLNLKIQPCSRLKQPVHSVPQNTGSHHRL